jgi:hypothetical protein
LSCVQLPVPGLVPAAAGTEAMIAAPITDPASTAPIEPARLSIPFMRPPVKARLVLT